MNINRDNYESFFLLYVDNELSAADREAVDLFIKANPDLQDELNLLMSATLSSEELVFIPKTQLYKISTESENVQESLLLNLDDELSEKDRSTVNEQINSDDVIAAEWNILLSTKLDKHEVIKFQDKASLYRHTNNVVTARFLRLSVAAVLTGIGFFVGLNINWEKDKAVIPVVSNVNPAPSYKPEVTNSKLKSENIASNKVMNESNGNAAQQESSARTAPDRLFAKQSSADKKNGVPPTTAVKDEVQWPEIKSQRINEMPLKEELIAKAKPEEIVPEMRDVEITSTPTAYATLAVNEERNSQILYMDEEVVTRSMLGGVVRKVKRIVERNTKIKTSNGLRIGGFEFAVK